jgi:hypothetical protein
MGDWLIMGLLALNIVIIVKTNLSTQSHAHIVCSAAISLFFYYNNKPQA